jgi:hypothetical protein
MIPANTYDVRCRKTLSASVLTRTGSGCSSRTTDCSTRILGHRQQKGRPQAQQLAHLHAPERETSFVLKSLGTRHG